MINKFIGILLGIVLPFFILAIRSLSAYYLVDKYLQENKYGISRIILTPLLGTGSFVFTLIRSVFCIPGDLFNSMRIGYEKGIIGVLATPFSFATTVGRQVRANSRYMGMTSLFGGVLCGISILQDDENEGPVRNATKSNKSLIARVEEQSKAAIIAKRAETQREEELQREEAAAAKRKRHAKDQAALATQPTEEKARSRSVTEEVKETKSEQQPQDPPAQQDETAGTAQSEKTRSLLQTPSTIIILGLVAANITLDQQEKKINIDEEAERKQSEVEKVLFQEQLQKNQALYRKVAALSQEVLVERPSLPADTLEQCGKMRTMFPPAIGICYNYVSAPAVCPLSGVLDGKAEDRVTAVCYDDAGLLAGIYSYHGPALLDRVVEYKDRTDSPLDCEALQHEKTLLIRGYYADAVEQIKQFVKERKEVQQKGRSNFLDSVTRKASSLVNSPKDGSTHAADSRPA